MGAQRLHRRLRSLCTPQQPLDAIYDRASFIMSLLAELSGSQLVIFVAYTAILQPLC